MTATNLSCNQRTESSTMPSEIADNGDDSPGGSLKFYKGGDAACQSVNENTGVLSSAAPTVQPAGAAKLPDPWLFDSEALLREIDRIRETALQVPTNGDMNATHFGLQLVINATWTLRENLRYILGLHRERQRAFGKKHKQGTKEQHQTIYGVLNSLFITC